MAIGDAYATAALYRAETGASGAGSDTAILRDLTAVSRFLDRACDRPAGFNKDASAVERLFIPRRTTRSLLVNDLVSVSAITIDEGMDNAYSRTLASTDYELRPLNAADGPQANPYTEVYATEWGVLAAWSGGVRVKISAVWGWPAVPEAIQAACIHLTAVLRLESPRATSSMNEMQQVVSTSRAAQNILGEIVHVYGKTGGAVAW